MGIEVKDFIGVFHGAFTPEFCDELIEQYEIAKDLGLCGNRQQFEGISKSMKADTAFVLQPHSPPRTDAWAKLGTGLFDRVVSEYASHFQEYFSQDVLLENRDIKIQKTLPKEGYHLWHSEHAPMSDYSKRLLAWIVYLNDVDEGGETEFLYQSMRVKPKKGTAVIFPTMFTHTHRGNPPLSGEKYIATGWITYAN